MFVFISFCFGQRAGAIRIAMKKETEPQDLKDQIWKVFEFFCVDVALEMISHHSQCLHSDGSNQLCIKIPCPQAKKAVNSKAR